MTEAEKNGLSPELAQHIMSLSISHEDQQRIDALLEQAQAGTLSEQQQEDGENLNHVADLISLWHSKVRNTEGIHRMTLANQVRLRARATFQNLVSNLQFVIA